MTGRTLRILIVADDVLVRAGLGAVLNTQTDCTVAGQVSADANLAANMMVHDPDVVLWDLGWEPTLTPAVVEHSMLSRLAEQAGESPPIVALVADASHAPGVWAAGARGLLPRDAAASTLAAALHAASHDLVTVDLTLAARLFVPETHAAGSWLETLTPREHDVLQRLAQGLPNKAIARQLNISEHTVKFHVNAILGKLGAQSRTEAVVLASRLGLLTL